MIATSIIKNDLFCTLLFHVAEFRVGYPKLKPKKLIKTITLYNYIRYIFTVKHGFHLWED